MDLAYKSSVDRLSRTVFSLCKMQVTKAINVCQEKMSSDNHSSSCYFGTSCHILKGY